MRRYVRRVLSGFTEGRIDFAPSYRWERDVEEFSWKRGQAPSYTDRVFHRSLPGVASLLRQTAYKSATFMFGSDAPKLMHQNGINDETACACSRHTVERCPPSLLSLPPALFFYCFQAPF